MDPWKNLNFRLNFYGLNALGILDIQISPPVHFYSQKGRPLWPDPPQPPPVRVGPILADPLPPPKLGRPLWTVPYTIFGYFLSTFCFDTIPGLDSGSNYSIVTLGEGSEGHLYRLYPSPLRLTTVPAGVWTRWVSFLPSEPAAAEGAKHSALHWSHVGTQSIQFMKHKPLSR